MIHSKILMTLLFVFFGSKNVFGFIYSSGVGFVIYDECFDYKKCQSGDNYYYSFIEINAEVSTTDVETYYHPFLYYHFESLEHKKTCSTIKMINHINGDTIHILLIDSFYRIDGNSPLNSVHFTIDKFPFEGGYYVMLMTKDSVLNYDHINHSTNWNNFKISKYNFYKYKKLFEDKKYSSIYKSELNRKVVNTTERDISNNIVNKDYAMIINLDTMNFYTYSFFGHIVSKYDTFFRANWLQCSKVKKGDYYVYNYYIHSFCNTCRLKTAIIYVDTIDPNSNLYFIDASYKSDEYIRDFYLLSEFTNKEKDFNGVLVHHPQYNSEKEMSLYKEKLYNEVMNRIKLEKK